MTPTPLDLSRYLVIDLEASGIHPDSWPTELAWGDPVTGIIQSRLIRPENEWTHWDPAAEAITGISRARLLVEGSAPAEVTALLAAAANGKILISDAPRFDGFWLRRLVDAAGFPGGFRIGHVQELWLDLAAHTIPDSPHGARDAMMIDRKRQALIQAARKAANETAAPAHRAGADVAHHLAVLTSIMTPDPQKPEITT